jgi:ATP-binding cassette subfamily C protein LapB
MQTNDDKNKAGMRAHSGIGGRMFLKGADILILIFASLIINLFALAVPLVTLQVYDRILSFQSEGTLQVLCAGVFVVVVLDIFIRGSRSSMIGWASARFEHKAYMRTLTHLLSANLTDVKKFSYGEQLHKLSAIAKLKGFYSGQSLINLIDLPFVAIFIGFIAYIAGALVIVPLVLLTLFTLYAISLGRSMKKTLELRNADDDSRTNFTSEILDKVHTVKMLGMEESCGRYHDALQGQNIYESHALNAKNAQSYNASSLFTQIMMVSMITVGAVMALDGQITMGVLIACVLLSGRIMQPLQRALLFWVSFQEYRLAKEKIDELFVLPMPAKINQAELKAPRGKLEIKNLEFSYNDSSSSVFDGLSLSLKSGKAISLGGFPGDGKSTLMKLIAGLHPPDKGQILIDGMDASAIPSSDIAKYVGYLSPQAEIFQGTIMDNLTGFRTEREDEAREMANYLGIDRVVSKLSHGYQTELFDGPADPLTPGMKQRISIARVLVNRPRILLFDYADKSLDREGYNHLFKLLGQLKGQATMILASNDRNIVHLAEDEYVLEHGKLIAMDVSSFSKNSNLAQPLKELRK